MRVQKRDKQARTNEGLPETCWEVSLLSSPGKRQTSKAKSEFWRTALKCVYVCVHHSPKEYPAFPWWSRFVLLLNSRCHSRPPTCWETAKCPQRIPVVSSLFPPAGDPHVLTLPIWTLQPSPALHGDGLSVLTCVCESHYAGVKHEIRFYSCASARWRRFSPQACVVVLTLMLVFIPAGFWLQQAHTWTFLWTWGPWGRYECCDPSNWSRASPVRTSITAISW